MAMSISALTSSKDNDRWGREIELQKALNLTQSEASIFVAKENGLTVEEIAEIEGVSARTVKNTISNARRKIQGESDMEIYISRVSPMRGESAMSKQNIILVIANLCKEMGCEVNILTHTIVIRNIKRSQVGDKQWFATNVERMVDMYGTRSDAMASERAKRIKSIYDTRMSEQRLEEPRFGHAVIRYYLDKNYIPYDVYDVE